MTRLLFLILNYKTWKDTVRITTEILSEPYKDIHILIVDNASPNESFPELQKIASNNVEVISSPENGGYAKGNNYGLRYAEKYSPEYVCIINNDVHFSRDTINKLIDIYPKLESPAIISPIQVLPDGKQANFFELNIPDILYDIRSYMLVFQPQRHKYKSNCNIPNVQRVGIIPGAFLFVKYNTFKDIGFFDEDTFLFCEERFLGKKIQLNKLNNYIVLDAQYLHEHSKTISNEASSSIQTRYLYEGKISFWKRYGKFPKVSCHIITAMKSINSFELSLIKLIRSLRIRKHT